MEAKLRRSLNMHMTHQSLEDLPQGQLSSVLPPHFVHRGEKANVGTSEGFAQHVHLFSMCYLPGGWHCTKPPLGWIAEALYPLPIAWVCLFGTPTRQMNAENKCNTESASDVNHILLPHVRALLPRTGIWLGAGMASHSALGLDGAAVHGAIQINTETACTSENHTQ